MTSLVCSMFECSAWPPFTAVIEANCFCNCLIAWSTYKSPVWNLVYGYLHALQCTTVCPLPTWWLLGLHYVVSCQSNCVKCGFVGRVFVILHLTRTWLLWFCTITSVLLFHKIREEKQQITIFMASLNILEYSWIFLHL